MVTASSTSSDRVKGRTPFIPHDPTITETDMIVVEEEPDTELNLSATLCLVAWLWTERSFNARAFMNTMKQVWRPVHGVEVSQIDRNLFVFQFFHWRDKQRVLDQEPWNFDDQVIFLKELTGDEQLSSLQLCFVPMWVKVYDIPFNLRSQKLVENPSLKIGEFMGLEPDCNLKRGKFKRFRILFDARRPLVRGSLIASKHGTMLLGMKRRLILRIPPYGDWLRASPKRNGSRVVHEEVDARVVRRLILTPASEGVVEDNRSHSLNKVDQGREVVDGVMQSEIPRAGEENTAIHPVELNSKQEAEELNDVLLGVTSIGLSTPRTKETVNLLCQSPMNPAIAIGDTQGHPNFGAKGTWADSVTTWVPLTFGQGLGSNVAGGKPRRKALHAGQVRIHSGPVVPHSEAPIIHEQPYLSGSLSDGASINLPGKHPSQESSPITGKRT
ncbi:hypothetical protein Tsubulata_011332 [Turnera subulata]|uniref:DUF4283 domain-containing protein n=1 Tax=Turnera subulata TaxID=218843 RepID=A0A9Q0GHF9_9ROSI|nr:hypothetical protein Tsubulata_011332 [Turnera subulata]